MENILHHVHSGLRWVALLLLLITIAKAFSGWLGNKTFTEGDRKLALFTLISMHLQFLIGISLYIIGKFYQSIDTTDESIKAAHRFFGMEHISAMIVAIILITIGNARAKRASSAKLKFKSIAIFFLIGLIIILAMIPWPFHLIAPVKGGWY